MSFNVGGLTKSSVVLVDWLEEANPAEEKSAGQIFDLAKKYFRMEMYEKAIGKCDELLENYGKSSYAPAAQLMIGDSNNRLGKADQARKDYDKVITTYPPKKQVGGALSGRGDIYYDQKNWGAARKEYRQVVVDRYKGKKCTYQNLVWYDHAKARLVDIDKKIADAQKTSEAARLAKLKAEAKKLFDEGMGLYNQAVGFHQKKQYDPAENRYLAARGKFYDVVGLYRNEKTKPYEYHGKAEEMIDKINKALAQLKKVGETAEAQRLAKLKEDAKKLFDQGMGLYNQGVGFHKAQKFADAKEKYLGARGKFSDCMDLYLNESHKPYEYHGKAKDMIDKIDRALAQLEKDIAAAKKPVVKIRKPKKVTKFTIGDWSGVLENGWWKVIYRKSFKTMSGATALKEKIDPILEEEPNGAWIFAAGGRYRVQAGAFRVKANAKKRILELIAGLKKAAEEPEVHFVPEIKLKRKKVELKKSTSLAQTLFSRWGEESSIVNKIFYDRGDAQKVVDFLGYHFPSRSIYVGKVTGGFRVFMVGLEVQELSSSLDSIKLNRLQELVNQAAPRTH